MDNKTIKNRICVIDDDEDLRSIYQTKLEEEGYWVTTAKNGEEGLDLIKKEKPDLVLVDINMPKKDGIELIREIRDDKEIFRTRIIVLTNRDDLETVKKIEACDIRFYVVKALATPQKVASLVKEALV